MTPSPQKKLIASKAQLNDRLAPRNYIQAKKSVPTRVLILDVLYTNLFCQIRARRTYARAVVQIVPKRCQWRYNQTQGIRLSLEIIDDVSNMACRQKDWQDRDMAERVMLEKRAAYGGWDDVNSYRSRWGVCSSCLNGDWTAECIQTIPVMFVTLVGANLYGALTRTLAS